MIDRQKILGLLGAAVLLAVSILIVPALSAQRTQTPEEAQEAARQAEYQAKLQQILNDKAGYVANIVSRWEDSARQLDRWDENYAADLTAALMKLQLDNLLAAGEASSLQEVMNVLATGRRSKILQSDAQVASAVPAGLPISEETLGSSSNDLVYTPVTPCRIVDTRYAGGPIAAGATRDFDVDNATSFASQGGNNGPCGIPYGVAQAVAMTITVTGPSAWGWFTAWSYGYPKPNASVLNYDTGDTLANTTIVPVWPGPGFDMSLYSSATAHAIIDVVGYYAAPVATALDCTTVTSPSTSIPTNFWYRIDVACPVGRTATGGGFDVPTLNSLEFPGVWTTSKPGSIVAVNGWSIWVDNQSGSAKNVTAYAVCCRIPGR